MSSDPRTTARTVRAITERLFGPMCAISDRDLLAAIRRGGYSCAMETVLRDEATKRGLLL